MHSAYPGILAILLYAFGAYSQLRSMLNRAQSSAGGMSARRMLSLAVPAVTLHALSIYLLAYSADGVDLSFFTVASTIALGVTLTVVLASLAQPLANLYVFVFPLSVIAIAGSLLLAGNTVRQDLDDGLVLHAVASILAYTALTMAAFQAILFSILERRLRNIRDKRAIGLVRVLPPLETMESMLFRILWVGLVFLTVSIATGFVFLDDMFDQRVVHHTVLATASWITYVILLIGHYAFGWRARTATRWTLTAFTLLVLAYFGSKFVLEFILANG